MSYTIKPNKAKTLVYTYKGKEYRVRGQGRGGLTKTFENLVKRELGGVIPKGNEVKQLRTNFYKNNIFNAESRLFNDLKALKLPKNKNAIKLKGGEIFVNSVFEPQTTEIVRKFSVAQNFEIRDPDRRPATTQNLYDYIVSIARAKNPNIPLDEQWAKIKFYNPNDNSQVAFRPVNIGDIAEFQGTIAELKRVTMGQGSDTDIIDSGMVVDTSFFQLSYKKDQQGGNITNEGKKVFSTYYKVKNYVSEDNNCLIACIVNERKSLKKCREIRLELSKLFNIPLGTPISIDDMNKVEDYFKINIDVYGDDDVDEMMYKSPYKYEKAVEILLKDCHYLRITKHRFEVKDDDEKKKYKKEKKKTRYLFYDLETIFDKKDVKLLKPYSCSWFIHYPEEEFDYLKNEKLYFKDRCKFSVGKNCMSKMMGLIMNPPPGYKYKIIGFNNSRFDNFFLASKAEEYEALGKNGFFYANNSILNMYIGSSDTFDLCRFVACSLKDACKNFQTNPSKMEGYSHLIPQKHFDNGGWDGLMKFINDNHNYIEKYNKFDVLSLCDLTMKVRKAVHTLLGGKILTDYMTIGQMAYKHFQDEKKYNIPRPKTYEDDKFIRSALCAGRTQAYYKKMKYEGGLRMVDAKSLYPFVMMNRSYPVGEYCETKSYVEDKKGIYRCKIIHQFMEWKGDVYDTMIKHPELHKKYAPIVYPLRSPEPDVPLNWEYREEQEVNLTNIDIECIRRNGGAVEVYEGIYWEKDTDDLFKSYLEPLMNEKNKQDKLKKNKDAKYNVALRELCKLFSNCLSGKVIQKNYEDCFERIKDYNHLKETFDKLKKGTKKIYNHGSVSYVSGKLIENNIYKKSAKPSYLGVFIYSYARDYMYESILNKYVCLYEDTDSALLPIEEYNRFIIDNADNIENGKYGCFEEEVGDATKSIMLAPKSYCVINEKNDKMSKYKFKGVRKDDRYICLKDLSCDNYKDITDDEIEKVRNEKLHKKCNTIDMFEDLYNGNDIVVFQSVLVKSRGSHNEDDTFNIKQRFLVKLISA